ncbi:hypothetical protein QNH98_17125 [Myroides sp. mNGS23_01]|nr:hypothetical protein [Myroides sp. mNGS23_01]WHT38689.1 hypothetical protein QNH98_17125 [Myroides sp. mNGS23_01]
MEFYSIKQYFDNKLYLQNWDINDIECFNKIIKKQWEVIKNTFLEINDSNIIQLHNQLEFHYIKDFWFLFNMFKCFKKIDPNNIDIILNTKKNTLINILKNKETVDYYKELIFSYFISNPLNAELIVSYYEQHSLEKKTKLYFPKGLSKEKVEYLVGKYIDSEKPNMNFLSLIVNSQNKELNLSDIIKYKASKRLQNLSNEFFNKQKGISFGASCGISFEQEEPIEILYNAEERNSHYSYSKRYLDNTLDYSNIFKNFADLFFYLDKQGCISLVKHEAEINILERIFMRSEGEFLKSTSFVQKDMISDIQVKMYKAFLLKNKISIEDVIEYILKNHFLDTYNIPSIYFSKPSEKTEFFEKIRTLVPEIESILKQYQSYIDYNEIDLELLKFASTPLFLSKIKSKLSIKYVYGSGNDFNKISSLLFSDQVLLAYIKPYEDRYENLYGLLSNEEVSYDMFEYFQKESIKYLIDKEVLFEEEKILKINKINSIIFENLYYNDVINFWHFPFIIREQLLKFEENKLVVFENTLFTKEEISYFNYYLNKKEFTNGLNLRNKYSHGSNYSNTEEQEEDYNKVLKILILILLKIDDDLKLTKPFIAK